MIIVLGPRTWHLNEHNLGSIYGLLLKQSVIVTNRKGHEKAHAK